jgi:hypothetical protein
MEAHSEPAEPNERDTTDEWRIAPARALISVAELEGRIDVALATARTAEEAALEIGAASLEAAEQARRAAAHAERASASAAHAAESARQAEVRSIRSAPSALVTDAPVGSIEPVENGDSSHRSPFDLSVSAEPTAPGTEPTAAPIGPTPSAGATLSPLDLTVPTPNRPPDPFEDRITAFRLRAERVMIRLQKIEAGSRPAEGPPEIVRLG